MVVFRSYARNIVVLSEAHHLSSSFCRSSLIFVLTTKYCYSSPAGRRDQRIVLAQHSRTTNILLTIALVLATALFPEHTYLLPPSTAVDKNLPLCCAEPSLLRP